MEEVEELIKIPLKIKKEIEKHKIDLNTIVQNVVDQLLITINQFDKYSEIKLSPNSENLVKTADIPEGFFLKIPNLSLEQYESIVDASSWEYLDGILVHHSPESNYHNSILNFLNYRIMNSLNPNLFIIRTSRVALSIDQDKLEPDLMIFDSNDFRKKKRIDGSESEIIESTPLIVFEIVSKSSLDIDNNKESKYLSKGVKEYWRIYSYDYPINVSVSILQKNHYETQNYTKGEVRSRIIPNLALTCEELNKPDLSR